jgi:hypothetical protein
MHKNYEQQEAMVGKFPGPFHQIVPEGYRSFVPSKMFVS